MGVFTSFKLYKWYQIVQNILIYFKDVSGLTIFEFINHDKVTFLSARISPNSPHFPRQVKYLRFPLISR